MKSNRISRGRFGKRLACLVSASILAAGFIIGVPGFGGTAHAVALDTACSLTVTVEPKTMDGGPEEMPDVVLDLYKVADAVEVEGQDTYTYETEEGSLYEGLVPGKEDMEGAEMTNESWKQLAQHAAGLTFSSGKAPDVTVEELRNDRLTAGDLGTGLYLVIARGRDMVPEEYIVREEGNPEEGDTAESRVATIAWSDSYVFTYEPQLISLPTKEADADGNVLTSNPGDWIYNASVVLKPELSGRFAALRIDKELLSFYTGSPATFVFTVEATLNGRTVYSNALSMTFNGPGTQSELVVDKIPVGAEVVVTEVYSGNTYRPSADSSTVQTLVLNNIGPEDAGFSNIASFQNEYDGTGRNGTGITNHFEYADDGAGLVWNWTQIPASEAAE